MSTRPAQFTLPDLLAVCSLKGSTNPHYEKAAAESSAWILSYSIFSDRKRAFFIMGSNELLVSHTYPYAGIEQFRTCCDFVNLLFVVDEVSDEQNGKDARKTCGSFFNAMKNSNCRDNSVIARMTKEFKARFVRHAGPGCQRRFLKHCQDYVEAVIKEAELRERSEVLNMRAFRDLRRENSAIRLCFGLFEYVMGVDLPDEVFEDSAFMSLYWAAADMVCWSNDVYSYNMEQSKGIGGNNIITVLMQEKNIPLQEACDYVGKVFAEFMSRFQIGKQQLLSRRLGAVGPSLDLYVKGMENWIIGNLEWSFVTQRYFGPEHDNIKRTRVVTLRPREDL